MLTPQPPNVVDRFEPVWTLFCPPSRAVIDWLDQLMPAATPPHTLELTLSGNDRQHTYRLPCVTFDRLPYLTEPSMREPTGARRGRKPRAEERETEALELAILSDLAGLKLTRIAADLGYACDPGRDHSRPAARLQADGRAGLARLGAWPWSLQPAPPRGWRHDSRYARALMHWHRTV